MPTVERSLRPEPALGCSRRASGQVTGCGWGARYRDGGLECDISCERAVSGFTTKSCGAIGTRAIAPAQRYLFNGTRIESTVTLVQGSWQAGNAG